MRTERSGSLTIQEFDSDAWEAITQPTTRTGEVRVSHSEPIPCPSPWRHPIRWLRWNPFMQRRTTLVMPNCDLQDNGDGTITLLAHRPGPEPFPGFNFAD